MSDKTQNADGSERGMASLAMFDAARTRQARLGQNLRRIYDDVASAPTPDRFKDLLDQLDNISSDGALSGRRSASQR